MNILFVCNSLIFIPTRTLIFEDHLIGFQKLFEEFHKQFLIFHSDILISACVEDFRLFLILQTIFFNIEKLCQASYSNESCLASFICAFNALLAALAALAFAIICSQQQPVLLLYLLLQTFYQQLLLYSLLSCSPLFAFQPVQYNKNQ